MKLFHSIILHFPFPFIYKMCPIYFILFPTSEVHRKAPIFLIFPHLFLIRSNRWHLMKIIFAPCQSARVSLQSGFQTIQLAFDLICAILIWPGFSQLRQPSLLRPSCFPSAAPPIVTIVWLPYLKLLYELRNSKSSVKRM